MVMRQYKTAANFARIIRTLGYLYENGEDIDDLLELSVKAGISSLNRRHFLGKCSSSFLVDALMFELHNSDSLSKASEHVLLKAINLVEQFYETSNSVS